MMRLAGKRLIAAAALCLAAAAASAAPSQEERIVTGSRIERPQLESGREQLIFADQPALFAVIADPPRDEKHPARNRQLVIPSGPPVPALGRPAEMNALFFLASGAGPKPTMILLHGLPGNERNLDLAQAVRRAGWNVLTFTYRGAWGSEGTFSIQHAIADAGAALNFLRSDRAVREFSVDRRRIVLAGHSMGGFAAAATAAADTVDTRANVPPPEPALAPRAGSPPPPPPLYPVLADKRFHKLAGLVLLDAWDIARTAEKMLAAGEKGRRAFIKGFDDIGRSLGPITAEDIANGLARRGRGWDLRALAPRLRHLPVLSIHAAHGITEDNRAFAAALKAQPGARLTATEFATDHSFTDHRVKLAVEVVKWLERLDSD